MNVYDAELTEQFGKATYKKGLEHYLQDNVKKLKSISLLNTVTAVVENKNQQFRVAIDKADLSSICTCDNSGQCEHAVATLIAAEAKNLISRTPVNPFDKWQQHSENALNWSQQTQTIQQPEKAIAYCLQPVLDTDTQFTRIQLNLATLPTTKTEEDNEIVAILNAGITASGKSTNQTYLEGETAAKALPGMLETGRCFWQNTNSTPLQYGAPRKLKHHWKKQDDTFKLSFELDKADKWFLIPAAQPWYYDPAKGTIGTISTHLSGQMLLSLINLPALDEKELIEFSVWQTQHAIEPKIELPLTKEIKVVKEKLTPVFRIGLNDSGYIAKLRLKYGEYEIPMTLVSQPYYQLETTHASIQIYRNQSQERKAFYLLENYGFAHIKGTTKNNDFMFFYNTEIGIRYDQFWLNIFEEVMPLLISQGWQVEFEKGVHPISIINDPEFEYQINENKDWFKLGMKIDFEGQKIDLIPVLVSWLKQTENWRNQTGRVKIALNRHQFVRIHIDKLKPVLDILQEATNKQAQFSNRQAHLLNNIPEINSCIGGAHVKRLANILANFEGIRPIDLPPSVNADLRPYQQQGLNWLMFLMEYQFGGILADDMGLGKTLQTLSMLEVLRLNQQLDKPALVVCPTSLVGNWLNEAEKFTPELKIKSAHGINRQSTLDNLAAYDVVITTYPLINRDFEQLEQQEFKILILDEAQNIKNPRAQMTQSIKRLNANYRLCLSGTPIENHLGELWSLFDFLMPGFLGPQNKFSREYRKPIETIGDKDVQKRLHKKIKPFVLRRKKEEVAKELPKKTEIIKYISLDNDQRMLYEAIRVSMEDKVKNILKDKGLAKSQLECLDALLKLRQICCAPQLLNFESTQQIRTSAKLEYIKETLPEMLEEGRKILLFSQFAQMLHIISGELEALGIPYAKLTGETRDRQQQIEKFQNGEVSVFLISLKAGGTGLNLTAADTVIHYDPWWNPASEAQASDRAYRIGQTKPVFVYKLICEETIEEKVLKMQESKKSLNQSMFGKQSIDSIKDLTADNILELFKTT
ncbi:SNF2-related protein [Catenovulum sp. 2E275]|uniref:SNF2-related protein n=1 Tax=Catenovulum sp. 2E275 TaxID=2980497 RepID=UPI0021D06991|nr:SNF2-related protein [Catenovulum sp. 2E275]MCU4676884.1 SNF2-related protein [Catenovulum sp. 2E275]